jgi:galactokinase
MMITSVGEKFRQLFGREPVMVCSPGRINLIGEHTDYNEGFVLPAAIDKYVVMAMGANGTGQCHVYASAFDEHISFDLENAHRREGWINYVAGVVYYLRQQGHELSGFDAVLDSNLPVGAGLSSSAAVEGAVGVGLTHLFGLEASRLDLAKAGQLAEHNFAGVKCGIMDQFANLYGKKDHLIRLDCRDLSYQYFPFPFSDHSIVLCHSGVHHALASSQYNLRRQQCEQGVQAISRHFPAVKSLRDVDLDMLDGCRPQLDEEVYKRCRYVIGENQRLWEACRCLADEDLTGLGRLIYASHEGLSTEYEVSCEELDFLVSLARERPEVAGARMMGGGFGGCTLNVVHQPDVEEFADFVTRRYRERFDHVPQIYVTRIEEGARVL